MVRKSTLSHSHYTMLKKICWWLNASNSLCKPNYSSVFLPLSKVVSCSGGLNVYWKKKKLNKVTVCILQKRLTFFKPYTRKSLMSLLILILFVAHYMDIKYIPFLLYDKKNTCITFSCPLCITNLSYYTCSNKNSGLISNSTNWHFYLLSESIYLYNR